MMEQLHANSQWKRFIMESVRNIQVVSEHFRRETSYRRRWFEEYFIITLKAGSTEPWMADRHMLFSLNDPDLDAEKDLLPFDEIYPKSEGSIWVEANGFPEFEDCIPEYIRLFREYESDEVNEKHLSIWWEKPTLAYLRRTKMIR
jgi:hypothetical protein